MKKIILSALLLSVTAIAGAQELVAIRKQGHFSVGGTTIQRLEHTITVNSLAGRNRKKPDKAIVPTMLSWIIRFLLTASCFRWSMCMVMEAQAFVGK
nr:hypothetical protein [uncultured Bacteroides sp.]